MEIFTSKVKMAVGFGPSQRAVGFGPSPQTVGLNGTGPSQTNSASEKFKAWPTGGGNGSGRCA